MSLFVTRVSDVSLSLVRHMTNVSFISVVSLTLGEAVRLRRCEALMRARETLDPLSFRRTVCFVLLVYLFDWHLSGCLVTYS